MKSSAKGSKTKVYVGMSGGVDSSVSAALLQEQGYDVTGVFIKVWQPDWYECTWREDRLDAMRVCVHLGIPFKTLDLEKEYKKEVVDYMVSEYKAGRTPNPDIMCNKYVKFGGFYDYAMKSGTDFVATGHYAQSIQGKMIAGVDQGKDQSYFLWTLTKEQIAKTIFPVGGMEKSETRTLARKYNLPVAEKKDSQGLCFIGKVSMKEFLSHYIESKKGDVVNEEGKVIGEHDGALFHTIGERHGFIVHTKTPEDSPYYIIDRDLSKNILKVSHKGPLGKLSIEKNELEIESVNWIGEKPAKDRKYHARIRHLGDLLPCMVTNSIVTFDEALIIASGQSIVIYDEKVCLGGGIVR